MVGAGVLVEPLLGIPHAWGVIMVGAIVITIVATAGMASTTYVQFLKGALLIVFSSVLVGAVVLRGLSTTPNQGGTVPFYEYAQVTAVESADGTLTAEGVQILEQVEVKGGLTFARVNVAGSENWWYVAHHEGAVTLMESQSVVVTSNGKFINGAPESPENQLRHVGNLQQIRGEQQTETGSLSIFEFLAAITDKDTTVRTWKSASFTDAAGDKVTVYYPKDIPGDRIMRPGLKFKVEGTLIERLDFLSLMLALFLGTAALPHILIRYYTVPNPASARKSTIVAIAAMVSSTSSPCLWVWGLW